MDSNTDCTYCGSKNTSYWRSDYDYDGNERVHTWDVFFCEKCKRYFDCNHNDPYEDEE